MTNPPKTLDEAKDYVVEVKVTGFYRIPFKAKRHELAHNKAERICKKIENGLLPHRSKRTAQWAIYDQIEVVKCNPPNQKKG